MAPTGAVWSGPAFATGRVFAGCATTTQRMLAQSKGSVRSCRKEKVSELWTEPPGPTGPNVRSPSTIVVSGDRLVAVAVAPARLPPRFVRVAR